MCGEHQEQKHRRPFDHGSSPRVWGTLFDVFFDVRKERFIPTCVGNTYSGDCPTRKGAVHPHVCGEHVSPRITISYPSGSSPRVWGTPCRRVLSRSQRRFIPTCVGNTNGKGVLSWKRTVHPHVCGEHAAADDFTHAEPGSSPRVWGTPQAFFGRFPDGRFIPTCVGNTSRLLRRCLRTAVHPHVCGEHGIGECDGAFGDGSSPRVWGTPRFGIPECLFLRFIPTCVGNTDCVYSSFAMRAVHPHVCGEHTLGPSSRAYHGGSSPRVWGTQVMELASVSRAWFIPTCVGNTTHSVWTTRVKPVHPHVCGEHEREHLGRGGLSGSSPRVWGTLHDSNSDCVGQRFIPTCVGNTK